MSFLSPDSFAVALVSLMRIQGDARKAYLENRLEKNEAARKVGLSLRSTLLAEADEASLAAGIYSPAVQRWAARVAVDGGHCDRGREFDGVIELDQRTAIPGVKLSGDRPIVLDEGRFQTLIARMLLLATEFRNDHALGMNALYVNEQAEWLTSWLAGKQPSSPWGRFASSMLDLSLDVLAQRPELLGGGKAMRAVIAAALPNIARAYAPNDPQAGVNAARLSSAFAEGAIQTLIDQPQLVSTEPRWQLLVSGVLDPLQEEVSRHGLSSLVSAEGRLKDMFSGPMGAAAVRVIAQNTDAYLKGGASADRLAGVVIRSTFGEYIAGGAASFNLRKVFSPESIEVLARKTLSAAQERPELFLRSDNPGADMLAARSFLSGAAELFQDNTLLRRFDKALAGDLLALTINAVANHVLSRLEAGPDASLQAQLGASLATSLLRDIFEGFKEASQLRGAPGAASAVFDRFGRSQMLGIIKTVADYAARSPTVFLGKESSPHVVLVARTIAEAIGADEDGLLAAEEWQLVALACVNAALENPNTLFGNTASGVIAKRLIVVILAEARQNVSENADGPGQVLFGRILSDAIIETLDAASTGVLNILSSEDKLVAHLDAVRELMSRLNALAASRDTRLVIGSREWIRIYRYYVADVLQRGADSVSELTEERLLDVLKASLVPLGHMEDAG